MEEEVKTYPQLRPPKITTEEGVKVRFPDILQKHFVYLLVGRPGAGKSHLISELVTNDDLYGRKFNRVLFITPSKIGDIQFDDSMRSPVFDIAWLNSRFLELEKEYASRDVKKLGKANVLLVLDDCVSDLSKAITGKNTMVIKMLFNRRHCVPNVLLSFVITTQKYTSCAKTIRDISTGVFLFQVTPADWGTMQKEIVYENEKYVQSVMQKTFAEKHGFIYINLQTQKLYPNLKPLSSMFC